MRMSRFIMPAMLFFIPASAVAQEQMKAAPEAMADVRAAGLQWGPLDVPGFVPGMKIAVVSGDPGKEAPYVIRLAFPAGYVFPGHWHPGVENVTVLSGTLLLGMGDKTDKSALKEYQPGDFLYIPGRMPHFGGAKGETVIQLHGVGPFALEVTEKIPGAMVAK